MQKKTCNMISNRGLAAGQGYWTKLFFSMSSHMLVLCFLKCGVSEGSLKLTPNNFVNICLLFVCADVCVFGKWILPLHIVLAVQTGEEKQSESDRPTQQPNTIVAMISNGVP